VIEKSKTPTVQTVGVFSWVKRIIAEVHRMFYQGRLAICREKPTVSNAIPRFSGITLVSFMSRFTMWTVTSLHTGFDKRGWTLKLGKHL
jgi:hypothetical protein